MDDKRRSTRVTGRTPALYDLRLRDPLSEVTRKERKLLLVSSALGVAVVKTGLLPTKIEALGIAFSNANTSALLKILSLVVLYFLVAFVLYAASDLLAWRLSFLSTYSDMIRAGGEVQREENEAMAREGKFREASDSDLDAAVIRAASQKFRWAMLSSGPVSVLRALFEFALPVFVGAYALSVIWRAVLIMHP